MDEKLQAEYRRNLTEAIEALQKAVTKINDLDGYEGLEDISKTMEDLSTELKQELERLRK